MKKLFKNNRKNIMEHFHSNSVRLLIPFQTLIKGWSLNLRHQTICELFIFLHFACRGVPGGHETIKENFMMSKNNFN